jgi:signal transduction histidine kinase
MILLSDNITSQFIEILSSWSNPFLLILFFSIVILLVLFFINRHLIKPLEQKHLQEKKELELKNNRMMALFAELDPDPVVRIDSDGKVNFNNQSASDLLEIAPGDIIFDKFSIIEPQKLIELIGADSRYIFPLDFNGVHYNVVMQGNSSLRIAQLYLRDISVIKNLETKLKQLSNYLQYQLDEERFRIANELHDGIIQDLYLVQMGVRKLSKQNSIELIDMISSQVETVTEELRRIIYDLKPKILDELGLEPALQSLCNNVIKESGINGSIKVVGINSRLSKKVELFFYRVIQEAVSNIVKHSGATEFGVILTKDDNLMRAMVIDNGCGLKKTEVSYTNSGFGLINMKERTEGFGGVFKLHSTENEGLTITAEIPVPQ